MEKENHSVEQPLPLKQAIEKLGGVESIVSVLRHLMETSSKTEYQEAAKTYSDIQVYELYVLLMNNSELEWNRVNLYVAIELFLQMERTKEQENATVERDKTRKKDPEHFSKYVEHVLSTLREMVVRGEISDFHHVSQSRATSIEEFLDSAKVDILIIMLDGTIVPVQLGTTEKETERKRRHLPRYYLEKSGTLPVACVGLLDPDKRLIDVNRLRKLFLRTHKATKKLALRLVYNYPNEK